MSFFKLKKLVILLAPHKNDTKYDVVVDLPCVHFFRQEFDL